MGLSDYFSNFFKFGRDSRSDSNATRQNGDTVFINPNLKEVYAGPDEFDQIAAWHCGTRAISEDTAKLPRRMVIIENGEKKPVQNSPLLNALTKAFNPGLDPMSGIETTVNWLQNYGNAYFEVTTNTKGEIALWPIHPTRVKPVRIMNGPDKGLLKYEITYYTIIEGANAGKQYTETKQRYDYRNPKDGTIAHLKGFGDGDIGYSILTRAALNMGIAVKAQNYTGAFFGNNLQLGAVISTDQALDKTSKDSVRQDWEDTYGGSDKAFKLGILDRGTKYMPVQMSSTDAELLQTRKFSIEEIARWLRIPPVKLMDLTQSTYNNNEQQDINYMTDSIVPWVFRLEVQLKFIFHRDDNKYIEIDENALTRGDMASRANFYKEMRFNGVMNANQIAQLENLPKIDGDAGDAYWMPLNMADQQLAMEKMQLENQILRQQVRPVNENGDSNNPEIDDLRFQSLKSKFDAYGVAVRAGAITPQTADEREFRREAALPAMSGEVNEAWNDDGGVRRPITLQSKTERDAEIEELEEENLSQQGENISQFGALDAYRPVLQERLQLLVNKENLCHQKYQKCTPQDKLEKLNKFYIRFEKDLAQAMKTGFDFICQVLGKDDVDFDDCLILSKDLCQQEKSEDHANHIINSMLEVIEVTDEAPRLKEVRQGEDGENYVFTMAGWVKAKVEVY